MPWKISDVESKKKGLTPEEKKKWVSIANSALKSCIAGGGNDKTCAPRAIRIANSKFALSQSEIDTYLNATSVVNFASSIKVKELKNIKVETTDEGLLIKDLPVFKAGVYRDIVYSEDYIDRNFIGQFEDEEDIPVQADHNPSIYATLGWVKAIKRKSQIMYADLLLTDDNAISRWKKGLLKKFSISVDTLKDKLREISIVAFPYVKSAHIHSEVIEEDTNIGVTEINGNYFVDIEDEQFEVKKNEQDLWFLFPISRRDKDGEIVQEESVTISDEDVDNIDIKEDISLDKEDAYGIDEDGVSFTKEDFAEWTTKYKNSLPDSSFLLIKRPVKDKNRDRTLPIRDKDGKISRSHVQNALARVNQVKGFSSENIETAKKRLIRISKKLGMQSSKYNEDIDMKLEDLKKLDLSKISGEGTELLKEALEQITTIEGQRDELQTKLSKLEVENKNYAKEAKESKVSEAVTKLKTEGKITPAQEQTVKDFMLTLDNSKIDSFIKVVSNGKAVVDFTENAELNNDDNNSKKKDILDIDSLDATEINNVAEGLAKEHSVDFHDALDWCYDGKVNKAGKLIK